MTARHIKDTRLVAGGRGWRALRTGALVTSAAVGGAAVAYLLVGGQLVMALALLLAFPAFLVLQRYPIAVISVWLLAAPFLTSNEQGTSGRTVFWLVHRALPVVAVLAVVITRMVGIRRRPLPRLGWPELAMAAYVISTVLSVAFTSPEVEATLYLLYDRVFVPMCLYLLIRLLEPGERQLRLLLPVLGFVLVSQSLIGALSWISPELLPAGWLGREGTRTVGSLQHPNVFGTTMLLCGAMLLHGALSSPPGKRARRTVLVAGFILALAMVFFTYSRASWLAGGVVVLGLAFVYRRFTAKFALVIGLACILLLGSGLISGQAEIAAQRFNAEESALSRLPIALGSTRMFLEKPVGGWGYGNFDRYNYQFQGAVDGLVVPDKEHPSHNLYLTILAEQGIIGLFLFLFPVLWWLGVTRSSLRKLPPSGLISRNLIRVLWLGMAAFFIVTNFSNLRVVIGTGLWWMTLGLIASVLERYRKDELPGQEGQNSVPADAGRVTP